MALYSNNGASPGSGIPGGSRVGNQLTRNTGRRPAGMRSKGSQSPPKPSSVYKPTHAPSRGTKSLGGVTAPMVPVPQASVASITSAPIWNSAALMQAAMTGNEYKKQLMAINDQIAGLKQGWDSGTSQYHTKNRVLDLNQMRNKMASNANAAGRGILSSGMSSSNIQDINESYQPQYEDVEKSYGKSMWDTGGTLDTQKSGIKKDFLNEFLGLLMQNYQNQIPQIPGLDQYMGGAQ